MIARETADVTMNETRSEREGSLKAKSLGHDTNSYWPSVPAPVRRVFDHFPLRKYDSLDLPQRVLKSRHTHVLYIFAFNQDVSSANLSCNPACLRWQAYLKFNRIPFSVRSSNNHASPSGALPFFIPTQTSDEQPVPIVSSKISKWVAAHGGVEQTQGMRQEVYGTLIEHNIRNAWLYYLYLESENFDAVARPLYINPSSKNRFVRLALAYQLKEAAQVELLKTRDIIDVEEVYILANTAFKALSTLLGDELYFSGSGHPGLFDASIFAYTHLLLHDDMRWQSKTLTEMLERYPRLVYHRNRILDICLET